MNAAINGIDATLANDFNAFTSSFNGGITNILSTLNTFQPVVSFVSGNGVTFTGV